MFKEDCWFVYGMKVGSLYVGRCVHHSQGSAGGVDFDWELAWKKKPIGWFHSHPGEKFTQPSSTDHKTMRSWVRAFGRPVLCGISCGTDFECYEYSLADKDGTVVYRPMGCKFYWDYIVVSSVKDVKERISK